MIYIVIDAQDFAMKKNDDDDESLAGKKNSKKERRRRKRGFFSLSLSLSLISQKFQ